MLHSPKELAINVFEDTYKLNFRLFIVQYTAKITD